MDVSSMTFNSMKTDCLENPFEVKRTKANKKIKQMEEKWVYAVEKNG